MYDRCFSTTSETQTDAPRPSLGSPEFPKQGSDGDDSSSQDEDEETTTG